MAGAGLTLAVAVGGAVVWAAMPATAAPPSTVPSTLVPPPGTVVVTTTTNPFERIDPLPEPEDVEPQTPRGLSSPDVSSGPLVPFPPGCVTPRAALAVFEGEVVPNGVVVDQVQFRVVQVRAGSVQGWVDGTDRLNVLYGTDARFLEPGGRYLVGVAPGGDGRVLTSRVRATAQMFGGDAVIGLDESEASCPLAEEQVLTLTVDGKPVESGVLSGLSDKRSNMLRAFWYPMWIGFAGLLVLVVVKQLIWAFGRSLRDIETAPPKPRRRRHHTLPDEPTQA
jgi:hypothetical protein